MNPPRKHNTSQHIRRRSPHIPLKRSIAMVGDGHTTTRAAGLHHSQRLLPQLLSETPTFRHTLPSYSSPCFRSWRTPRLRSSVARTDLDLDRASGVKERPSAETKDGRKCSTSHQMRLENIRRRGAEMGRAWE